MTGEQRLGLVSTVAASFALALAGLYPGNNPDTFGHLAQGRQIAGLGHVPQLDTWSLLPGPARPWHNYEWLSDLGTWLVFDSFGYEAVTLFKCLLLVVTVICLSRVAAQWAGARAVVLTNLVIVSTIPAIRVRLSDRPHVLGICLAAAFLWLLTLLESKRGKPAVLIAALAFLHLIWVNAHGSHLLGLAISGSFLLFCSGENRRWFGLVCGLQILLSCVSPYGPAIALDAIDHVLDPRYRQLVSEWQPWRETDPVWLQLGPVLHGAVLAVLGPRLWRVNASARAALPVAVLLGAACFRSIRFLAELMLLTSPLIGVGLSLWSAGWSTTSYARTVLATALLLLVCVPLATAALPPAQPIALRLSAAGLPSSAGTMLARHARQPHVFAAMEDSWYLMFAAPNSRLALDGRATFHGPDHLERVTRAFQDRAAFEQLAGELHVDTVIVGFTAAGERGVGSFLAHRPDWSLVLIEDVHATYVRAGVLDDVGSRSHPPLQILEPTYELAWLLEADTTELARIEQELASLSQSPGTSGYRSWVRGVLRLRELRRGGPADGFRWPRNEADWTAYREALPLVRHASSRAPRVPVVAALEATLAATFCQYDVAEAALDRAMLEGVSREPLLAAQELALRQGRLDDVRAVVTAARALPRGKDDPWLAELANGLVHTPACPL